MSHLLRVLQKNKSLNPVYDRTQTIPPSQLPMFNVTQSQAWEASPVPVPWEWPLLSSFQPAARPDTCSKEVCSNALKIGTQTATQVVPLLTPTQTPVVST